MSRSRIALGAVAGALKRRVVDRPLTLGAWLLFFPLHRGQAEIDQLCLSLVGDQDVCPLDVAVSDAALHRVFEPLGHPQHQRAGLFVRNAGAQLHEIAKVHPLDVFHDHVMPVLLASLVDHLNDVLVVQLHARLGFLMKPIDCVWHLGKPLPQDFDGQGSLGGDVLGAIDARKRPLGQMEKDLGIAEEETAGIAFLEAIDLPARDRTLAQQHPQDVVG